jgi:hypothetical protein
MSDDNALAGLAALAPRVPLQAPASEPPLQAPPAGVTVRMYRQGLGDCFLLAFPTGDPGKSYYVLIDCGVLQGAPNGAANLNAIARDIQMTTGGQIHLLVATHRHADHISGFQIANSIFAQMAIHNLWLAWAEKPDDPVAQSLWKKSGQALTALTRAVNAQPAALAHVASVLDFVGDLGATGGDPLAPVRQLLKSGATPEYHRPGDGPLPLPAVSGFPAAGGARLYVLGPPTSLDALGQMDPASGSRETYLTGEGLNMMTAFMMGGLDMEQLSGDECTLCELSFPFARSLQIPKEEARKSDFFRSYYGFDDDQSQPGAGGPQQPARAGAQATLAGPDWRRIDDDWLGGSEELALQLDNCINNTSLVLAIELVKSGKVLLFAADAQVGNWLSWANLPGWTVSGAPNPVTVQSLLQRTVLYKVGHHGSHNATAAALASAAPWGLELMDSPDLVAMLPVDEDFANQVKHWPMPWPNMMKRLNPRTSQRVMRLDNGIPQANPGAASASAWDAFAGQVKVTDLYIQYTVSE